MLSFFRLDNFLFVLSNLLIEESTSLNLMLKNNLLIEDVGTNVYDRIHVYKDRML
jgi:hypothetical protein